MNKVIVSEAVEFLELVGRSTIHLIDPEEVRPFRSVTVGNLEEQLEAARDREDNVYVQVTEAESGEGRIGKKDVAGLGWLFVDCDPSSQPMMQQQMDRWASLFLDAQLAGLPAPTALVETGRGIQCLWHVTKQTTEEGLRRIEEINKWIAQQVGAPPGTNDRVRLLRLPGSVNVLSPKKKAEGYTPATARLICCEPTRIYTLDDFGTGANPAKPTSSSSSSSTGGAGRVYVDIDTMPKTAADIGNVSQWAYNIGLHKAPHERAWFYLVEGDCYSNDPATKSSVFPDSTKAERFRSMFGEPTLKDRSGSAMQFAVSMALLRLGIPDDENMAAILTMDTISKDSDPFFKARRQTCRAKGTHLWEKQEEDKAKQAAASILEVVGAPVVDIKTDELIGALGKVKRAITQWRETGTLVDEVPVLRYLCLDREVTHDQITEWFGEKYLPACPKPRKKAAPVAVVNSSSVKLERNPEGFAFCTDDNIAAVLAAEGIQVRKNEMTPWKTEISGLEAQGFKRGQVTDTCLIWLVQRWAKYYFKGLTWKLLGELFKSVAHINRYHPVKDYLESLTWDGTPRLNTWLIRHAKLKATDYLEAVSALPLLAAVKRIYSDTGVKFDELVVLQSLQQGTQKSTAVQALVPCADWYSFDLPLGADAQKVIERTEGKWIIEAQELDGMTSANHTRLKAFLSTSVDSARAAYGVNNDTVPRQWIAIGTTNDPYFLSDPTGNRRYWPIAITEEIDVDGIIAERDQIWAEALVRVNAGESIRLDRSLWPAAAEAQDQHTVKSSLAEMLVRKLGDVEGKITNLSLWCLVGEMDEKRRQGRKDLHPAMTELEWKPTSFKLGRANVRGWQKGASENVLPVYQWPGSGQYSLKEPPPLYEEDPAF